MVNSLLCWASFSEYNIFKTDLHWTRYKFFVPLYGGTISHCRDLPEFVNLFIQCKFYFQMGWDLFLVSAVLIIVPRGSR